MVLVLALCVSAVMVHAIRELPVMSDTALMAGLVSFSDGDIFATEGSAEQAPKPRTTAVESDKTATKSDKNTHTGSKYPISEINISSGTESYDNINIRNTTSYSPDYGALLEASLPFSLDDSRRVQVLVYHTHTCESYIDTDTGEYYEDFYPRSTDPEQGVCAAGERLCEVLKARGIGAVHDTTLHDYPSYDGSYDRSYDTVSEYLAKYPDIKVTIDLHRDSMTTDEGVKYKPTFRYHGEKAAQIMIMTGHDDTMERFEFWDENLIFATQLQKKCEDMYPGMTRPMNFGEFTYNMNANNGSLLIEVGTDANTVEEACTSAEMLANALAVLLQKGE